VRFQLHVTDPVGRTLALEETSFLVQPAFVVSLTSVQPSVAFPGMRVTLTGFGFSPVLGQNVVITSFGGAETSISPDSVSPDATSLTIALPTFHPVGVGTVRVEVGANASNALRLEVLGLAEALDSWRRRILAIVESVRTTPEARARLERAYRFYRDEVLVKLWQGEFGGRFGRIATFLDHVGRRVTSAAEAGADVGALPAEFSLAASLLNSLPEVRRATVDPSPRIPLTQGTSREYRVVLLGPGEREVPISGFPPFAKPILWRIHDEAGNAIVSILSREGLRFKMDCIIARESRVRGTVAFTSTLPAEGFAQMGTVVRVAFEVRQPPPTGTGGPVPISAAAGTWIGFKQGFLGPQPGQEPVRPTEWLPRGDIVDESRRGNLALLHVWWVVGDSGIEREETKKEPDPGRETERYITVFLEDITTYKGVAGNRGKNDLPDMGIELDLNPAWVGVRRSPQGPWIVVSTKVAHRDLVHVPLFISSWDFAGSCRVWAQADDADRTPAAPKDLDVPLDDDRDWLPNAEEKRVSGPGFTFNPKNTLEAPMSFPTAGVTDAGVDVDLNPEATGDPGAGLFGDGLSAFEEYRGFVLDGEHERLSDFWRDVFVFLKCRLAGTERQADLSYVATFIPTTRGLWRIGTGEWDNDTRRRINFNNEGTPGWLGDQRALMVLEGEAGRPNSEGEPEDTLGRVYIGVVDTGPDGKCDTARSGDDDQLFPVSTEARPSGMPGRVAIDFTAHDGHRDAYQDQIDLGLAGDDGIVGTTVTTGPNGVREMPILLTGDQELIKLNDGEYYAPCIEVGPNAMPETKAEGNDTQLMFVPQHNLLGTPNEAYLIEIDVLRSDSDPSSIQTDPLTRNDPERWTLSIIAHEIGHGMHIEHYVLSSDMPARSVMMFAPDGQAAPSNWLRASRQQIRLHLKHGQSPR